MKPFWGTGSLCALLVCAVQATPVHGAWNNVFQVCCNSCKSQPTVSNYGPDPCNPCPQPVCTTRYVQRCYYQPVTTYTTKSYYEPVTTYRTSYYYEPVTSYRYSCYYDPCTCSYQQVACPTTSYKLRSQCCPVQSWVQRCCQVPVTSYRIASYWEPVTSCCTPSAPSCSPTSLAVPQPQGATPQPPLAYPPQPNVTEGRAPGAPGVSETPGAPSPAPLYRENNPPQNVPAPMPGGQSSSVRQLPAQGPTTLPAIAPKAQPKVRIDRIVSLPRAQVQGQVFLANASPRAGARVSFVNARAERDERNVTADPEGKFKVTLAAGAWKIYVHDANGQALYHSQIEMRDNEIQQVSLLSR
jgi:hypothetical protein